MFLVGGSGFLVNVCVRTEGTSASVPGFENGCLPCDSTRPLSIPLPMTIQEGARNEGMSDLYTKSQFINLPAVEVISKG